MEPPAPTDDLGLITRLEDHHHRLSRLRRRLRALRKDHEHCAAGGKVYYAVDWSELSDFLTGEIGDISVGFNSDPEERARRARLGLAHLFNTLTDTLYLLPPHAYEMWSFIRLDEERLADLHARATRAVESLHPKDREVLELLVNGFTNVSQEGLDRLVALVKGEFEDLCDRVTTFITSFEHNVRGRLRQLVQDQKVSYSIEPLFQKLGLAAPTMTIPDKEVGDVASKIPRKKSFNKRRDAKALLQLRGINRLLNQKRAYMVLVTRDQTLRDAAEKLAKEPGFGWPEARQHFRHVETIYLDLALRGSSSQEDARQWTVELDDRFDKLEESALKLLSQQGDRTFDDLFASDASRVLDEAKRIWDEHVNLRLSLTEANVPWLTKASRMSNIPHGVDVDMSATSRREITLIKRLWEFVKTDRYKEAALSNAHQTWVELHDEALRMVLLSHLGNQGTTNVVMALTGREKDGQTTLRSTKYSMICSLQFVSATYQSLLAKLRRWDEEGQQRIKMISEAFLEVVRAATIDTREAEGFLFMAFLLGRLGLWAEARVLAERSLRLPGKRRVCEVEYFLAVASRKLATDDLPRLHEYVSAFANIKRAIETKRSETGQDGLQDPRYLKELGTIVLAYHEGKAGSHDATGDDASAMGTPHPGKISAQQAVTYLSQALGHIRDDHALRIDVLNNLAYEAIRHAEPDLKTAEQWSKKLNDELEQARKDKDPSLPHKPWPGVRDTLLLIEAHRARKRRDVDTLQRCADDLAAIAVEDDLPPGEQKLIQAHVDQVRGWHSEASAARG